MSEIILPKRSRRFGVGKEIGGAVYLHRNYESLLGEVVISAWDRIPSDFPYTVVKYNLRTGAVSFAESPDFDTSPEPIVGDHWIVPSVGPAKFSPGLADPYIYHHKWLMVSDNYDGFDVQASKQRSLHWLGQPGVDETRIGRLSYWQKQVVPRLDPPAPEISEQLALPSRPSQDHAKNRATAPNSGEERLMTGTPRPNRDGK